MDFWLTSTFKFRITKYKKILRTCNEGKKVPKTKILKPEEYDHVCTRSIFWLILVLSVWQFERRWHYNYEPKYDNWQIYEAQCNVSSCWQLRKFDSTVMYKVTILAKCGASFTGQQQAGVVAYPPAVPPRPQPSQVMSLLKNHFLTWCIIFM